MFLIISGDAQPEDSCSTTVTERPLVLQPVNVLHVNQVPKTNVPGEFEFLYAPYSVVTIESVTLPPAGAAPTPACPIRIVVVAALDNKDEPHDLPLSPWA